jgi:hypothetical protein
MLVLLVVTADRAAAIDESGQAGQSCLAQTFQGKVLVTLGDSIGYGFQIESFQAVVVRPFVPDEVFPGVEGAMLDRLRRRGISVG